MKRAGWADLLLAGPRGRRFCLAVTSVNVFSFQAAAMEDSAPAAAEPVDEDFVVWVGELPVTPPVLELVAAAIREASTADEEILIGEEEAFDCLAATTSSAMYWQPPDGEDRVAAAPMVVDALRPVAEAAAVSPATGWWDRPVPLDDQHFVSWIATPRGRRAAPPRLTGAAERLRSWRAFMGQPNSCWWSFPDTVSTSSSHGGLPATQLELVEDSLGFDRARVARLEPAPECRVLELITPQDWVDLVDAHPLDVTGSRDQSWPEATGGHGPWFLPDWSSVSDEYDAVHLTVLAYLSTAGRALACHSGTTVVAGWEPDVTYWLTDTLRQAEPPCTWTDSRDDDTTTQSWVRS